MRLGVGLQKIKYEVRCWVTFSDPYLHFIVGSQKTHDIGKVIVLISKLCNDFAKTSCRPHVPAGLLSKLIIIP